MRNFNMEAVQKHSLAFGFMAIINEVVELGMYSVVPAYHTFVSRLLQTW